MPKKYSYLSSKVVDVSELHNILSKIQSLYEVTDGFGKSAISYAELPSPNVLSEFNRSDGVNVLEATVTGYLSIESNAAWNCFSDIAINIDKTVNISTENMLFLNCGFEEKSSKQSENYYDEFYIRLHDAKKYFGYYANGSRVSTDPGYRLKFHKQLIKDLKLPLKINRRFRKMNLTHTDGGHLQESIIHPNHLPSGFCCEIKDGDVVVLVDMMKKSVELFSDNKIFNYSWRVVSSKPSSDDLTLNYFINHNLTKKYEVDVEYVVIGVDGLGLLSRYCEDNDVAKLRICSFTLPSNIAGELFSVTSKNSIKLLMNLSSKEGLDYVEKDLGIEFIQN